MILQKYTIATRISIVVGAILMMMLVLVGVEVKGLNSIRNSIDEIVEGHYQRLQIAQDMRFLARHGGVLIRNMYLVPDESGRKDELERFNRAEQQYRALLQKLQDMEKSEEEASILKTVIECGEITYGLWRQLAESIENPEMNLDIAALDILKAEVRSHQWGWLDSLKELVDLEQQMAEIARSHARENYDRTKMAMGMINVLAIVIGCFLVIAITSSIAAPLHEISRRVDLIASGDFSTRIELSQKGEVGTLANHINRMVEKLQASEAELNEYRYNLEELIEWRTGEVNEQRERFISVLIHDLKGPLIPIVGFSRLLMKKRHLNSEQIYQYATAIHDAASKLLFRVEQNSQALREKRFAYSFDRTPFDFEELLWSVCKGFHVGFREKNIRIYLNGCEAGAYTLEGKIPFAGDIGKIRSVFENLIGNAGKYAATRVDISLKILDSEIELVVDDDGQGIDPSFRTRIFEEYYQAPGSKEGTGLGLYSVKRVVDHYQGTITVSSSPIGGARFTVTLPVLEVEPVISEVG